MKKLKNGFAWTKMKTFINTPLTENPHSVTASRTVHPVSKQVFHM